MSRMKSFVAGMSLAAFLATGTAFAGDAESCKKVRLSDVGWTDIQATTGVASVLLTALGYQPEVIQLSVPVTYASLKNKDLDVFLGNWMPSMTNDIKDYTAEGSVETISQNLTGAGYGIVVPSYVADAGVKTLTDLGKFKDKFEGKIYGIEAGNDGNRIILDMIKNPADNLQGFELVESSEAGMLTQAEQSMKDNKWIAFLGWTPHPVMGAMKITYLDGMGNSGFGAATVSTNVRKGYLQECPNAGAFIKNLKFNLDMEGQMMDSILKGSDANKTATEWLKKNPDAVKPWLTGVTAFDGSDAAAAVKTAIGG
ncbi:MULTISPECIES: choline ABC transporter substrate-binding protein [Phyllobacteriaceae]|jgi:glycine betaine/proline transport system substrate-binding protein|uniref:Glycine/betaine ABC transporter substrate-binding protein n=1 Tax=Mesorhizobium hungaricum TaxID=1566387 RepID=A0A1C2EEW2_9HYPH|nr:MULTISPECIES: choline ABC transporter substrate-binding protein [Mesorhizobium]MBN9237569.1 choline ABC transporter substrate-binding protein [Mesorhizobium sp.]MDQ0329100.1 glycine betaine/proline transport system substrate-binding protein [Mesorhizobium sp. YL-MeA3-2017]OCX25446.1 glycine/betaine ABC transporter substrate-binding protein [Mesorhizobium hungaricum]